MDLIVDNKERASLHERNSQNTKFYFNCIDKKYVVEKKKKKTYFLNIVSGKFIQRFVILEKTRFIINYRHENLLNLFIYIKTIL